MKVKIEIDNVVLEYELTIGENRWWKPLIISRLSDDIIEVIEPTAFEMPPEFTMQVESDSWVDVEQGQSVRIISKAKIV